MRLSLKAIGGMFVVAMLCIPGMAASTQANQSPPPPGTLNYIEGQVSLGSQPLSAGAVGSTSLQAGQTLSTQDGRAEILLTPGVFLRLDDNSAVVMNSPGLATTELTLRQGRAMVEVSQIFKENDILIDQGGVSTKLVKKGLYEFNANTGAIRVFDGRAEVHLQNGKEIRINGGHQLALNTPGNLKAASFNKKANEDDFYRWASLRSSYLAEANMDAARRYEGGGTGWYGPGWYWDPWFSAYTWIPGNGIFWSPFGYGFYSPFFIYSAPIYGFNYYTPYYRHFGPGYVPPRVSRGFSNRGFHHNGGMQRGSISGRGFSGTIQPRGHIGGHVGGRR